MIQALPPSSRRAQDLAYHASASHIEPLRLSNLPGRWSKANPDADTSSLNSLTAHLASSAIHHLLFAKGQIHQPVALLQRQQHLKRIHEANQREERARRASATTRPLRTMARAKGIERKVAQLLASVSSLNLHLHAAVKALSSQTSLDRRPHLSLLLVFGQSLLMPQEYLVLDISDCIAPPDQGQADVRKAGKDSVESESSQSKALALLPALERKLVRFLLETSSDEQSRLGQPLRKPCKTHILLLAPSGITAEGWRPRRGLKVALQDLGARAREDSERYDDASMGSKDMEMSMADSSQRSASASASVSTSNSASQDVASSQSSLASGSKRAKHEHDAPASSLVTSSPPHRRGSHESNAASHLSLRDKATTSSDPDVDGEPEATSEDISALAQALSPLRRAAGASALSGLTMGTPREKSSRPPISRGWSATSAGNEEGKVPRTPSSRHAAPAMQRGSRLLASNSAKTPSTPLSRRPPVSGKPGGADKGKPRMEIFRSGAESAQKVVRASYRAAPPSSASVARGGEGERGEMRVGSAERTQMARRMGLVPRPRLDAPSLGGGGGGGGGMLLGGGASQVKEMRGAAADGLGAALELRGESAAGPKSRAELTSRSEEDGEAVFASSEPRRPDDVAPAHRPERPSFLSRALAQKPNSLLARQRLSTRRHVAGPSAGAGATQGTTVGPSGEEAQGGTRRGWRRRSVIGGVATDGSISTAAALSSKSGPARRDKATPTSGLRLHCCFADIPGAAWTSPPSSRGQEEADAAGAEEDELIWYVCRTVIPCLRSG